MSDNNPFNPKIFLKQTTSRPGVYQMLDKQNQVIYVGKAKNLKKRLGSYFREQVSAKTHLLVNQIHDIQIIVTETEGDALILEGNLIKKYKPRYNVLFRDDKSYPYIYASTKQQFPRLDFYRGARSLPGKYFGPYPSVYSVRETLNLLQKVFKLRSCNDVFFKNRSRPCLQYQINRCSAPCVGYIDQTDYQEDFNYALSFLEGKNEEVLNALQNKMEQAAQQYQYEVAAKYRDQIVDLRNIQKNQYIVKGKRNIDVVALEFKEGQACVYLLIIRGGRILGNKSFFPKVNFSQYPTEIIQSFITQYYLGQPINLPEVIILQEKETLEEVAALEALLTQQAGRKVKLQSSERGDGSKWFAIASRSAKQALAAKVSSGQSYLFKINKLRESIHLKEGLSRIECFDISHHRGEAPVASCVVFNEEGPLLNQYRRFNIKRAGASDDYAAMFEALTRRYTKVKKTEGALPDLIVIDGGKGQLTQAMSVMEELQLTEIPLLAIAKGQSRKPGLETLFLSSQGKPISLKADSPALHLLQEIRDEAHRFAITHNRLKVKKARQNSTLQSIQGVGQKRRKALLNYFGGMQSLKQASVEQISKVPGVSASLAQIIYDALHGY